MKGKNMEYNAYNPASRKVIHDTDKEEDGFAYDLYLKWSKIPVERIDFVPHLISSFYRNMEEICMKCSVPVIFPENHKKIVDLFKNEVENLKSGYQLNKDVNTETLIEHKDRVLPIDSGINRGTDLIHGIRKFNKIKYSCRYFSGSSNNVPDMKIIIEIFDPVENNRSEKYRQLSICGP